MAPSSPPSPPPVPPLAAATFPVRRRSLPILPPVTRAPDGCALDQELERRWSVVKARLQTAMHASQPVRTEPRYWSDAYTEVAYLCTHNDALRKRRMYVYVRQFVRDLVATQLELLNNLPRAPVLLEKYCRTWEATKDFVLFMKRILHHLHRYWIPDNANTLKEDPVRPLDKLLMFYWREDLLSQMPSVVEIALKMVDDDRRGNPTDHSVVRGVVDTLVEIGAADVASPDHRAPPEETPANLPTLHLYIRVFEDEFLAMTRTFYKAEGEKMVAIGDVTQFMKNVLARLDEEAERGKRLLHPDSGPRLRQTTEEQLIGNHIEYLQKEASHMVKAGREDDLKLVYTLLNRIENGLVPLRTFFVGYVRAEGNSVVVEHIDKMSGKDDMQSNLGLVRVLIKLYRKHASLVKRCFGGSQVIMMAIDDAFRGFANRALGNISLPNLIAHYVDHVLRNGKDFDREMWDIRDEEDGRKAKRAKLNESAKAQPGISPNIITPGNTHQQPPGGSDLHTKSAKPAEEAGKSDSDDTPLTRYLTELVRLFMYLDDKDLFFETHRRLFAKRLMSNHDEDLEMSFIGKIKVQMGPTYTQRLSGMLKDKLVSNTMRTEFLKYLIKKREDCERRKAEAAKRTKATDGGLTEEDIITPVDADNGADKGDMDKVSTDMVSDAGISKDPVFASRNMARPPINHTSGWSMLLNASNAQSEKDKAEKKEREEKSKKIDENILKFEGALRIHFNTHVLNALHWPAVKVASLRLPPVLQACQELFSDFYMRDKETRKLDWIHSLSTVNLFSRFRDKQHTLVVSTFQACILLLFNDRDSVSVAEACKLLNLTRDELCHHIKPLILTRKSRVLRLEKSPVKVLKHSDNQDPNNLNGFRNEGQTNATVSPAEGEDQRAAPQMPNLHSNGAHRKNVGSVDRVMGDCETNPDVIGTDREILNNAGPDADFGEKEKGTLTGDEANPDAIMTEAKVTSRAEPDANVMTTETRTETRTEPNLEEINKDTGTKTRTKGNAKDMNKDNDADSKAIPSPEPSNDQIGIECRIESAADTSSKETRMGSSTQPNIDVISTKTGMEGMSEPNTDVIDKEAEVAKQIGPKSNTAGKEVTGSGAEANPSKPATTEGKSISQGHLQDSDVIHINIGFKSKSNRVVVPASIAKLASTEAAVTKRSVVVDRSTQVDAMLVRIMKAKKEISHAALSAEVIEALSPMFLPDPRLIKSRLERLIDQEYVERDSEDPRLYKYAA